MRNFLFALLLFANGLLGQGSPATTAIEGIVKDDQGRRFEGVLIDLIIPSNSGDVLKQQPFKSTTSGVKGYYRIDDIPPGIYTMIFRFDGYSTMVQSNISVISGKTTTLNMKMDGGTICVLTVTQADPCTSIDTKSSASITHICNEMLERFR